MKDKLIFIAKVFPVILILDQITKYWIDQTIPYGSHIVVIENFFDLVHTRNKGAAFGILSTWDSAYRDVFFYAVSIVAFVFLYYFLKQMPAKPKWKILPLGLIFGGALGNICDRIFRGSVVDFLSVHWYDKVARFDIFGHEFGFMMVWPAFNVADSAITVGVIWLLIYMTFFESKDNPKPS